MKDGSFEQNISVIDSGIDFEDDFEIQNTALPNQMPQNFSLDKGLEKSGAIEALMSQNEDLMSRLGVALRRASQLEDEVVSATSENQTLKTRYESLKDQVLVFKEKARLISERKQNNEFDQEKLTEELRVMEIRYAELYQTMQTKEARFLSEQTQNTEEVSRLRRYRKRIQRVARSLQSKYRNTTKSHEVLSEKLTARESQFELVKSNLMEATEHIQIQKRELDAERSKTEEIIALKNNADSTVVSLNEQMEVLSKEKVEAENNLILAERKLEQQQMKSSAEINDLQSSMSRYRNEAKELAILSDNQTAEIQEKASIIGNLNKEVFSLTEQVENLQALWRDQQRKLEKHIEKNSSLQKLNQELSTTINQYRRDLREAKERIDGQIIAKKEEVSSDRNGNPELMNKIDKALGQLL